MSTNINVLSPVTMSSREIADLVGSRHDSVKRTIDTLSKKGVIGAPQAVEYLDTLGRPATQYVFTGEQGKRDSIVTVAQLSPEFTAKLVDRWQELEAAIQTPQFTLPTTFAEALRLAADQQDQITALEEKIEEDAPKVAFATQVELSQGAISIKQAAQILDTGQNRLFSFLRTKGWITRRNEPYQAKITAGLMDVKLNKYTDNDGNIRNSVTSLITGKGLKAVAKLLAEDQKEKQDAQLSLLEG